MKLVRGSVTPVDLTGQADGDFLYHEGGIWVPKTALELMPLIQTNMTVFDLIHYNRFAFSNTWTGSAEGTQTTTAHVLTSSGATAGSRGLVVTLYRSGLRGGHNEIGFDFDKSIVFMISFGLVANTTNGECGSSVGGFSAAELGSWMVRKGLGFIIKNNRLWYQYHDGTTKTEVDSGVTLDTTTKYNLVVYHHPGSKMEFYLGGSLVHTGTTDLPAGDDTFYLFSAIATNGADNANQSIRVNKCVIAAEL